MFSPELATIIILYLSDSTTSQVNVFGKFDTVALAAANDSSKKFRIPIVWGEITVPTLSLFCHIGC